MPMSDKTRARVGLAPQSTSNLDGLTSIVTATDEVDVLSKAERAMITSRALTIEDDPIYKVLQGVSGGTGIQYMKPTYIPHQLMILVNENNTLGQCIDAMEVNIDGTGYEIKPKEEGEDETTDEEATEAKGVEDFFAQPWPGESFTCLRRRLRRDLESCGNAYFEVIRDQSKKIVFLRWLDAKLVRLVALDDPIPVELKVTRFGSEHTLMVLKRERRFVMAIGTKAVYFREYGSSRMLDSKTGMWENKYTETKGGAIPPADIANEVIHFKLHDDVVSAYGVPRWINQIPSVLGSRAAEELNVEFFRSGGLPPAMILIQGGALSSESRTALTAYLAGKAKYKQRGIIAEVFSTSGDLASAGQVRVTVERFGGEKQKDSMFETYDDKCSKRVRCSFRLPALFLGLSEDYNFATAYASYMVAEAQIFEPERKEFDEVINNTIMKEIAPEYVFRSMPLSIGDVATQLKALEMTKDLATAESWFDELNEITSLDLVFDEENAEARIKEEVDKMLGLNKPQPGQPGVPGKPGVPGVKKPPAGKKPPPGKPPVKKGVEILDTIETDEEGRIEKASDDILTDLARDWADYLSGNVSFEPVSIRAMEAIIKAMNPNIRKMFAGYVGLKLTGLGKDPDGVAALLDHAGCCVADRDTGNGEVS